MALGAAALAWLSVAIAHAATLDAIQGEVMINRGGGYMFVSGSAELKPGDKIIANSGGNAQLTYPDGCGVPLQAGSVVTVGKQSPCVNQAGTGTPGLTPGTLAGGAVVLGGGVGAAILLGDKNNKPASP